jgi:hypothetical protein
MEVSGPLHVPVALPPGKKPRYPLERRLGGPQSRSGGCGEEKNLTMPGIERGASSPSLYRLSYPDSPITCTEDQNLIKIRQGVFEKIDI